MNYKPYHDLVTSLHRDKPRYMRWLSFLIGLFDINIGTDMISLFDVHTATGDQLDKLGVLIGMPRNFGLSHDIPGLGETMNDDLYRRLMLAKIIRNQFKGQQGSLPDLWENVFGSDLQAIVTDNQNMTMNVELIGDYTPLDVELVLSGFIVPKPMGVGMLVQMTTEFTTQSLMVGTTLANTAIIGIGPDYSDPPPFLVRMGYGESICATGTIHISSAEMEVS